MVAIEQRVSKGTFLVVGAKGCEERSHKKMRKTIGHGRSETLRKSKGNLEVESPHVCITHDAFLSFDGKRTSPRFIILEGV